MLKKTNLEKEIPLLRNIFPIDFHNHGVGNFDFANIGSVLLDEVEKNLMHEKVRAVLCMFVEKNQFENFIRMVSAYSEGKTAGRYKFIVGIGIEGPALSSLGGTPLKDEWPVTKKEWKKIAELGEKGLQYVVFSPDWDFSGSGKENDVPESMDWLVNTLLDGGVRPAPGHFSRKSAVASEQALDKLFQIVSKRSCGPIVTDHLFNDMHLNFKHAWRTQKEKAHREHDLFEMGLNKWNLSNIKEKMGPIPAKIIYAALDGLCKICINFDGDHVDYDVIKKTIEIGDAKNFMLMTDSCQSQILAGVQLNRHKDNSLLYQSQGVVACGTQGALQQMCNMHIAGFSDEDIKSITVLTPSKMLGVSPYEEIIQNA